MSNENINIRNEPSRDDSAKMAPKSVSDTAGCRDAFDERAQEFKDNQANSTHSHFGYVSDAEFYARTRADSSPSKNDQKNHDSDDQDSSTTRQASKQTHFDNPFGHHAAFPENNWDNQEVNRKYSERYSTMSLQGTNYDGTGRHSNSTENISEKQDNGALATDSTNQQSDIENQDVIDKMNDSHSNEKDTDDIAHEISIELIEEKLSDMQLTSDEKDRSNMMFMYLTYNDIKRKIEDLEMREHRAIMKHLWEEALRLREMKNRLELLCEKQIYLRDDLPIDSDRKEAATKGIEARSQQLNMRKNLCDSWMFSGEAKDIWDKWVVEDKKSHITDDNEYRDALLAQLEEEWNSMAEAEKQKISNTYNHIMTGSSMQTQMKLLENKNVR